MAIPIPGPSRAATRLLQPRAPRLRRAQEAWDRGLAQSASRGNHSIAPPFPNFWRVETLVGSPDLCFAARHRCFPRYAGPSIPPRRYAARRLSPLVVLVAKQKQLEGFFYAVVQGGRESLIQGRCVPNGRFSHLYHGGDIRPLRAEYSEPSRGCGEEVASHLSAPRAAISARGSRGQRLPQASPRACGTAPTSPFF